MSDKVAMALAEHQADMLGMRVSDWRTTVRVQDHQYTLRWAHSQGSIESAVQVLPPCAKNPSIAPGRPLQLPKSLLTREVLVKNITASTLMSLDPGSLSTLKPSSTSEYPIHTAITCSADLSVESLGLSTLTRTKSTLESPFTRVVLLSRVQILRVTKSTILDIRQRLRRPPFGKSGINRVRKGQFSSRKCFGLFFPFLL